MISETTLLLDRWLKHPTLGVAAMLPTVGRNTPEGTVDPLPPTPTIFNDVESVEIAQGLEPPTSDDALIVFAMSDAIMTASPQAHQRGDNLVMAIGYVTKDTPIDVASKNGNYVLRAVRKSLNQFSRQANGKPQYSTLNGITIASLGKITVQRVAAGVGKSRLWGFVLISVSVIDTAP